MFSPRQRLGATMITNITHHAKLMTRDIIVNKKTLLQCVLPLEKQTQHYKHTILHTTLALTGSYRNVTKTV